MIRNGKYKMRIKCKDLDKGDMVGNMKLYQSYRIIEKVRENCIFITFLVDFYPDDIRCIGRCIREEKVLIRSFSVDTRGECGTGKDRLHLIQNHRLNSLKRRGFELYRVKQLESNYSSLNVGDYVFAKFNGINYVTESLLYKGTMNVIPPTETLLGKKYEGFEDFYEKVSMDILDEANEGI